jgi:hypothetical protein
MGEWKTQISLRVSQDFRRDFEGFAQQERRKPSNIGCVLLAWASCRMQYAESRRFAPRSAYVLCCVQAGIDAARLRDYLKQCF